MQQPAGVQNMARFAERVFVFERIDPTDASTVWLQEQGVEVVLGRPMWEKGFQRYSDDEIIAAARGFDAVMGASGAHFPRHVLEALPQLKFISKYGVGYDSIDIAAAKDRGVIVTNTPTLTQSFPVAEHAIAMMLALRKKLNVWTPQFMAEGGWRGDIFANIIGGSTVGIVGLGKIGAGVAQRLAGWDVRILAFDPYLKSAPGGVELCGLDHLLAESDIVTLHAAPSNENRMLINAERLALMKPNALLINTGRAWLVDYPALRAALQSGQIAGAGLDVFETEPPDVNDPLFKMGNVVVSPHAATWTVESMANMGWRGARNLMALISREGSADIVNP